MNDLLTSDHRKLDEMLGQLYSAIDTGDAENVFEKLDIFWARLAMHIRAEHLHLFPAILKLAKTNENLSSESVKSVIEKLHTDHDLFMRELALAVNLLRKIIQSNVQEYSEIISTIREKINTVSQKLKGHNELEESKVYQWAETLLDLSERNDLNGKMQKELDNLPPRFRSES